MPLREPLSLIVFAMKYVCEAHPLLFSLLGYSYTIALCVSKGVTFFMLNSRYVFTDSVAWLLCWPFLRAPRAFSGQRWCSLNVLSPVVLAGRRIA